MYRGPFAFIQWKSDKKLSLLCVSHRRGHNLEQCVEHIFDSSWSSSSL